MSAAKTAEVAQTKKEAEAPAKAQAAAPAQRVALVTGANKGIGYAIVESLAGDANLTVLLGARDAKRGEEAVKALGKANVKAFAVDVDDEKSVVAAAEAVKKQYGGLDVLINNAGMAWKGDAFDENVATTTIRTNYFGVLHMLNHFLPLMKENGRVVNVSSVAGRRALKNMSKANSDAFMEEKLTIAQLTAHMQRFIADVKDNTYATKGWPKTTYGVSKAGCSMLTRIVARDNKRKDLLINACCPGWVRTDMAGPKADKSPAEGAVCPVHLALLPAGQPSGEFWEDKKVTGWM